MPLVHIHLREGKPSDYLEALGQGVHRALVSALTSEENPLISNFQTISQYKTPCFTSDPTFAGISRSSDAIIICIQSIKISSSRKQALFSAIVQELGVAPKIRKEDIFIAITELEKENWFVGV
jgi:4-oxalocrotonate tautomerase